MNSAFTRLVRTTLPLLLLYWKAHGATPLDVDFTYQGLLKSAGEPVTGTYEFRFTLYTNQVGSVPLVLTTNYAVVSNGLFTANVNFGPNVFNGEERWLGIGVRTNGSPTIFTLLGGRQKISAAPYALHSLNAQTLTAPLSDSLLSPNIPRLNVNSAYSNSVSAASFFGSGAVFNSNGIVSIGSANAGGAAMNIAGGRQIFNPRIIGTVLGGSPGLSNFLAPVQVFATSNRAYVTMFSSSSLEIFDISDPHRPALLGEAVDDSRRPGSPFTRLNGADGVFVTNGIAYVTSENDNAVTIINVSNPQTPVKLAEIVDGVGGFNGLGLPTYALVRGTNLYVLGFLDSCLSVIDISNPSNPRLLRELYDDSTQPGSSLTRMQYPYQMTLVGNYLYVAARGDHAINIFNVSDGANPQFVTNIVDDFALPGSSFTKLRDVNWVEVIGNRLYAVGGAFNSAGDSGFTIVDVSNPANPVKLFEAGDDSVVPGSPFTKLRGAWAVKVVNNIAVITSFFDNGVTFVDVSNPTNPTVLREWTDGQDGFDLLSFPEGLSVSGDKIYLLADGDNALHVIDLQDNVSLTVDGFVGIGTTTPRNELEVVGTITASSLGVGTNQPIDSTLDIEGNVHLNDYDIFLRGGFDRGHGLGWYGGAKTFASVSYDGPVLYGLSGGALGSTGGGQRVALAWDSIGNVRLGALVNTAPGAAGWGRALIFSGAPDVSATWNSDNSDPLWMARFNPADNASELRMVIGDDAGGDKFVVGTVSGAGADFSQSGTWTPRFSVDSAGVVRAAGTITGSTAPDIAETIPAAADVEVGDVVCADPAHRERAVRASKSDRGVLGVISDGSGAFLINAHGASADAPLTGKPLVLAGRVPVKVSLENGPIKIGDYLAPSSTAGVAMRATNTGIVIGVALDNFDSASISTGKVLCFVKVGEANYAESIAALNMALHQKDARIAELQKHVAELAEAKEQFAARVAAIEKAVSKLASPEKTTLATAERRTR